MFNASNTQFPLSTKIPNEISVTQREFNGVKKYTVSVPRGMKCEHGFRWCYEHLPAHTWVQYRNYIEQLDVNNYRGITWETMRFEFEDSHRAVEFALRFS